MYSRLRPFGLRNICRQPTRYKSSQVKIKTTLDSQTHELSDGRFLGFAEYGHPKGAPIFFFHGFPGSRFEPEEWDDLAKRLDARIISVDRPGMGLSTFYPNRKVLDWPADINSLAQHLKLSRFAVIGGSGGGAYSLACAKALSPEQLKGVGVLAGMGPWEMGTKGMNTAQRVLLNVGSWWPGVMHLVDDSIGRAARDPDPEIFEDMMAKQLFNLKGEDRAAFDNKETLQILTKAARESYRQGGNGLAEEIRLVTSPWGFKLEDITFKTVRLWYGTRDRNTPISHGRRMAKRLPHAELIEYPGETHFTIGMNHSEEVLKQILRELAPAKISTLNFRRTTFLNQQLQVLQPPESLSSGENTKVKMPQNDYIERWTKLHGKRLDHEERTRKREARESHKQSANAQNFRGLRAKLNQQKRRKEKIEMRKRIKQHEERNVKSTDNAGPSSEPIPEYLLDRGQEKNAKALSSAIKERRNEKAAKFSVPLPKVKGISEEEMFKVVNTGKKTGKKSWKRMVTKPTFVGPDFTRRPVKYERFIRPMGLRYKKANVTHTELGVTVQLPILGVKKNPQNPLYTQLGVLSKGTVIEVNVSELGMVTAGGKVVWGRYAQITNTPENDGCVNAVLLV
ncbi:MAG: Ribosome biogenesis protein [Cirrosporium novae-zelandiae]|nr:MAG: Ribosome biogenesis protein [Cirrosporium novae-zelandiae]